jgi:hypothetical protein
MCVQVIRANSTEGLSLFSNVVELLCYTIIVAYNLNHVSESPFGAVSVHLHSSRCQSAYPAVP